jgi:zinc/manganese transport system substrate-binding protein
MRLLALSLALFCGPLLLAEPLKVVVLHPLLGDLARSIGGEHVEVIDLIGPQGDPHHFEPSPQDIKRAAGSPLWLASGMGLEPYLPKLRAVLGHDVMVHEVGAALPALHGACSTCDHGDHEHQHDAEADPHWWHSIDRFRRAAGDVSEVLAKHAPSHADAFTARCAAYQRALDELACWTKKELLRVPKNRRYLATAHAAFQYFCNEFGFQPIPVQGINREQVPSAAELSAIMKTLREAEVVVVFPEKESNPKILATLAKDAGVTIAPPLIADGLGVRTYQEMIRHNVETIRDALVAKP